jgi:hypothetical protein
VQQWQLDLLGQIADRIDLYREGRLPLAKLVEDARGLFDAADISANKVRGQFEEVWAPVSGQLELRTADWAHPDWGSKEDLDAAITALRKWAVVTSAQDPSTS